MHSTADPTVLSPFQQAVQIAGILIFLCGLASTQGCSTTSVTTEQTIDAQSTVIEWLRLLDQKNYQATYVSTAAFFKERLSPAQWQAQISQARSALGETLSRQTINANYTNKLTDAPTGDYVIFQFQTEFSGQSRAVETVTVALDDNTWRTVGYFVR